MKPLSLIATTGDWPLTNSRVELTDIMYCDGLSFSGDRTEPLDVPGATVSPIYFRGRRVMKANINDLLQNKGLSSATDVVLSGHSAGGLATYLHADEVRALLPQTLMSYRAMPDAGFFLDHVTVTGDNEFGRQMRSAFTLGNTSSVLNAKCTSSHQGSLMDCVFPQNFAQYIVTPLHVIQSEYDSYQVSSILQLPCSPPKGNCNASMIQKFLQYGEDLKAACNASGLYSGVTNRAIWTDACIAHTQGYYGDYYDNTEWEVPSGSGNTLAASVYKWVSGEAVGTAARHVDTVPWPENKPCSTAGEFNFLYT